MHVGQKVTPKNDDPWEDDDGGEVYPQFGAVYTIRTTQWIGDEQYLWLCEIVNPEMEYEDYTGEICFFSDEFRLVIETKTEISFTQGAPKDSRKFDNRRKIKERI